MPFPAHLHHFSLNYSLSHLPSNHTVDLFLLWEYAITVVLYLHIEMPQLFHKASVRGSTWSTWPQTFLGPCCGAPRVPAQQRLPHHCTSGFVPSQLQWFWWTEDVLWSCLSLYLITVISHSDSPALRSFSFFSRLKLKVRCKVTISKDTKIWCDIGRVREVIQVNMSSCSPCAAWLVHKTFNSTLEKTCQTTL